jgi:hypothetical protein
MIELFRNYTNLCEALLNSFENMLSAALLHTAVLPDSRTPPRTPPDSHTQPRALPHTAALAHTA